MKKLEDYVISIPDFPSPGIIFRDVTSILQDGEGLHLAIDQLLEMVKDVDFDVIVGAESRGFIFGMPVAYELYKPLYPGKKAGKAAAGDGIHGLCPGIRHRDHRDARGFH